MNKKLADQIIVEFSKKIFGFAMKKSYSYDEAEELCGEILKEVYLSLLRADKIANKEGYIWRICQHTFAKYVSEVKKKHAVAIDGMEIAYYDKTDSSDTEEELVKLRNEIGFLASKRRKVVYSFYYEGKSIQQIAKEQELPNGTVKWHLNKARNELKEGFSMERKVGNLGINPIEAKDFGHSGNPGTNGGPEYFLHDKLNLNIVYSVYYEPKTIKEIAEELGMTTVFLEDRINLLCENGFLVQISKNRYTTYVKFSPQKISLEFGENILKEKIKVSNILLEKYVPKVRAAIADFRNVYIPNGNRELFEAAVIFYAINQKCVLPIEKDISKCKIKTLDGGDYFAQVMLDIEIADPDYKLTLKETSTDYNYCGIMTRDSKKYPCVYSWSVDSRLDSRTGSWMNNKAEDFEYIYEIMTGVIEDTKANAEKFERLYKRKFLSKNKKINIMIVKENYKIFDELIPSLDKEIVDEFVDFALRQAIVVAKEYPSQLQDLVIVDFVQQFIGIQVAMMVLDKLYENGTFKPLSEDEKVTSNLLMFADRLPE